MGKTRLIGRGSCQPLIQYGHRARLGREKPALQGLGGVICLANKLARPNLVSTPPWATS